MYAQRTALGVAPKAALIAAALALQGCGMIVGTVVDSAVNIVTYPVKEYLFWGAFKYDNPWEEPYQELEVERDPGELLLGIAVSGGGSRSAYFFACVMEELSRLRVAAGSERTFLDELDAISSVSGGSLAAAYYCLQGFRAASRPGPEFFRRFQEAMQANFEMRSFTKLVLGYGLLDFLTYYDRGDLMASVWGSDRFLGAATFQDLAEAERHGAPTLILNGTNLTDGLKFVFTTLRDARFQESEYFRAVREATFIVNAAAESHVAFRTEGFDSINSDLGRYPVSKAVVASAAVPNLLGPVTILDHRRENRVLTISDGGIYDNYGVESLMQLFTRYLDDHPGQPALIMVVDGSGYFEDQVKYSDEYNVADYSERPLSISWLRTKHYMERVLRTARTFRNQKGEDPYRNLDFRLVSLYAVLPSQEREKPLVEEAALQKILRPDLAAGDFLRKITTIQTRFKISADDAAAVQKVARDTARQLELGGSKGAAADPEATIPVEPPADHEQGH